MTRLELHALIEHLAVPFAAAIEQRRYRQRGADRQTGTRGGVFRQKMTDADRILATILDQRQLCDQQTLADLFGVSWGTIRNAIEDVLPILTQTGKSIGPAQQRFPTAQELLASIP